MRAIFESAFDILYLISVISIGIYMVIKSNKNKQYLLFGIMAITLGAGDAFHLIPRVISLCGPQNVDYTLALNVGKFITSITMTAFYMLLYYVYRIRYNIKDQKIIHISLYVLSLIRIITCVLPQNNWFNGLEQPYYMGIVRNVPFLIIGIIIIVLFSIESYKQKDKNFRFMALTIILSFGFYLPVVLAVHLNEMIGLLMIPKTCAYVWTVVIGLVDMIKANKNKVIEEVEAK